MSNVLDPIFIGDPAPGTTTRPKRHLRRVDRSPRRSPAVPVLVGAGMVIAALFAIAAMHALMIGGQVSLDTMQREVASETEDIAALRLRVAELEAPDRVLSVAEERLGMVLPGEVGYLAPLGAPVDDEPVRVAPAVRAPVLAEVTDTETEVDTVSPEQAEVDAGIPDRSTESDTTPVRATTTTPSGDEPDGTHQSDGTHQPDGFDTGSAESGPVDADATGTDR